MLSAAGIHIHIMVGSLQYMCDFGDHGCQAIASSIVCMMKDGRRGVYTLVIPAGCAWREKEGSTPAQCAMGRSTESALQDSAHRLPRKAVLPIN